MKENVINYKAESLEDIAKFFELRATRCGTNRSDTIRAHTFRECADILRRTTIQKPKRPRWIKIGEWATETEPSAPGIGLRTGRIENWYGETAEVKMQFGPDGPFELVHYGKLREADYNEIAAAQGVTPYTPPQSDPPPAAASETEPKT